jgi:hypothetical protein
MLRIVLIATAAAAAGAYALDRFGRQRTRAELEPLGRLEAFEVSRTLSFREAVFAGARAVLGGNAVPQETYVAGGAN